MPKRKRSAPSPSPAGNAKTVDPAISAYRQRCAYSIETNQKPLISALRVAASLERQKYSRRRKTALEQNDQKAISRLGEEYEVLKKLDIPKLAEQHLRKTIAKVKTLKDNPIIPPSAREIEKSDQSPAKLNVVARMCKVAAVVKARDEAIDDLRQAVLDANRDAKRKRRIAEQEAKEQVDRRKKGKVQEEVHGDAPDFSDMDSDVLAAFDARVAGDEDEMEESFSGGQRTPSIEGNDSEIDAKDEDEEVEQPQSSNQSYVFNEFTASSEHDYSLVSSEAVDPDMIESSGDEELIPATKAKAKAKAEKPSSSTFLPTLSHAAYFSGSESEASDLDEEFAAPRKNRRGQRARQQIWEKKYGQNAKHKQKEDRNKGWDPKRGAVDNDRGRKGGKGGRGGAKGDTKPAGAPRGMKTGYGPERSGENAMPLGERKKKTRDDGGQLHPSWQAAKAAKEKKTVVKPMGKKMVFD